MSKSVAAKVELACIEAAQRPANSKHSNSTQGKMSKLLLTLTVLASLTISTFAQSDTQYKSAIRGYWQTARHTYLYKADGLVLVQGSVDGHWSIRNGILYEQSFFLWRKASLQNYSDQ